MKILVGLGNPGVQYQRTKHNVGFLLLDHFAEINHFPPFTDQKKFNAQTSMKGEILLVKPQTFMNKSGQSVAALLRMYKDQLSTLAPDHLSSLYVLHDDLDLELGNWKLQLGTGPKIHNGLLSLYEQLGHKNFWHVRVGVDTRQGDRTIPSERYVLMPFTSEEELQLTKVISEIVTDLTTRVA